jgi:hypothetical protein
MVAPQPRCRLRFFVVSARVWHLLFCAKHLLVAAIGLTVTIGSSGISPRSYNGGGLYKMEPKELANVPAEAIAAMLPHVEDRPAAQGELFATRTGVAAR